MKKTNSTQKKVLTGAAFLIGIMVGTWAFAEPYTAQDGLDKIKTNLENSKANQQDYNKNLNTVNTNITQITNAKSTVQKQKDSVNTEIVNNNESLKKVILQEKELQQLITLEEQKKLQEEKQLEQLDKLTAKIEENQKQREALIAEYKKQLTIATNEKTAWKGRETELRAQETKTIQSLRGLATEEANWGTKKKTYEAEVKRWTSEVDKQQKITDTYQGLKENK